MRHTLLFGKNGQVGWELQRALSTLGTVAALDYPEVDFTNPDQLRDIVRRENPQVIVNAAAYTAVDRAESEPDIAMAINSDASGVLAEEAKQLNAVLVHYSTEYIFDGAKGAPYVETDPPNPLNVYGQTKLDGERAIQKVDGAYLILRTSWVYSLRQGGFVNKVMEWARQQPSLRIVADQVGSPTWCRSLADVTAQLLAAAGSDPSGWVRERRGLYHLGGDGSASRFEWARVILANDPRRDEHVTRELLAAKTDEFPTPAKRPLYAPLNSDCFTETFGLRLPPWEKAMALMMENA